MGKLLVTCIMIFSLFRVLEAEPARTDDPEYPVIRITTDRLYYFPGQMVWFSADFAGGSYGTDSLSAILVSLADPRGKQLDHMKLPVKNGLGSSSFFLPDTVTAGIYTLRIFDEHAGTESDGLFFSRILPVYTKDYLNSLTGTVGSYTGQELMIRFFPEGGNFLAGRRNKVGFTARDESGQPVELEGMITTGQGEKIVDVRTESPGFGYFYLFPTAGKQYNLQLISPRDSSIIHHRLPAVSTSGFLLSVENIPGRDLMVSVAGGYMDNLTGNGRISLAVYSGRHCCFYKPVNLRNSGLSNIRMSKSGLPDGTVEFILADEGGRILNRRIIYLHYRMAGDFFHASYPAEIQPGKEVQFTFSPASGAYEVPQDNLNLSVTHAEQYEEKQLFDEQFISNLLLCADHGVYRTNMEEPSSFQRIRTQEPGFSIRGKVIEAQSGDPVEGMFTLAHDGEYPQLVSAYSDSAGFVEFPGYRFYGTRKFVLVTNSTNHQEKDIGFVINRGEIQSIPFPNQQLMIPGNKVLKLCDRYNKWQLIRQQYYDTVFRSRSVITDSGGRLNVRPSGIVDTSPDRVYEMGKYIEFKTTEEFIREVVSPIVNVKKKKGRYTLRMNFRDVDYPFRKPFREPPLLLIDGVPAYDTELFLGINTSFIDRFEVFGSVKKIRDFWPLGKNGVFAMYTKSGNYSLPELRAMDYFVFEGFRVPVSFKRSNDVFFGVRCDGEPDFRSLVYWDPELSAYGGYSGEFTATDAPGNFVIRITGILRNGEPFESMYPFKTLY